MRDDINLTRIAAALRGWSKVRRAGPAGPVHEHLEELTEALAEDAALYAAYLDGVAAALPHARDP